MSVVPDRSQWFGTLLFWIAIALGIVLQVHPAFAVENAFTVNTAVDAVDANIGDGLCRTAANKCSLRAAIQEANADAGLTTITLKGAVYKLTKIGAGEDAGATGDYDIASPITINGVTTASSVIDANFLDRAFQLQAGGSLTLNKLTVKNGSVTGDGGVIDAAVSGGGITLTAVVIRDSAATGMGGAVNVTSGSAISANGAKFIHNLALQGGAVYLHQADLSSFDNALFDDNSAEFGGAIASYLTMLTIEDTRLEDNLAECYLTPSCDPLLMEGGAIYAGTYTPGDSGTISMQRVGFYRNGSSGWGGGFSIYNASLNISDATFDSNTAVNGAGAGYTFGSSGSVTRSAFINNTATGLTGVGGAVYFQDSAFTVSNSTFSGNSAFSGGGVYVSGDAPPRLRVNSTSIQHVTITNNSATDGGGLWLVTGGGGLTVVASILDGNTATSLGPDCGGATITISWTLISNITHCNLTGTNNITGQSANLGALSYGVNGLTVAHVPNIGSPAINAESACTVSDDQHFNPTNFGTPCTLGAVSGTFRNLLSNGSFESGVSGWRVTSPDGKDKVVSRGAYAGSTAFAFTGVSGKTAILRQTVSAPTALSAIQAGDTVCMSGMFYAKNATGQALTIQVMVRYSDGVVDKVSDAVTLTNGAYLQSCSGEVSIDLSGGRTISKIEGRVTSKSTKGKTYVDNLSLTWLVGGVIRAESATRAGAGVLGLPVAPEGFRK